MCRTREEKREENSPGHLGPETDWYKDPLARSSIGEMEEKEFSALQRAPFPKDHPLGFNIDTVQEGWVGTAGGNNLDDVDDRIRKGDMVVGITTMPRWSNIRVPSNRTGSHSGLMGLFVSVLVLLPSCF